MCNFTAAHPELRKPRPLCSSMFVFPQNKSAWAFLQKLNEPQSVLLRPWKYNDKILKHWVDVDETGELEHNHARSHKIEDQTFGSQPKPSGTIKPEKTLLKAQASAPGKGSPSTTASTPSENTTPQTLSEARPFSFENKKHSAPRRSPSK